MTIAWLWSRHALPVFEQRARGRLRSRFQKPRLAFVDADHALDDGFAYDGTE